MKSVITVLVMLVSSVLYAQQTNTLDTYRQSFDKQHQILLNQYASGLNTVMVALKKKGDLDNVLILQVEIDRYTKTKTVQVLTSTKDLFRPVSESYYQSMEKLLDRYISALNDLIKKEVASDHIEEAKTIKDEKDKVASMFGDIKSMLETDSAIYKTRQEEKSNSFKSSLFKPKTYVNETKGVAGNKHCTKNNTYSFKLDSVGQKATLRYWATGDLSTSTAGQVLLTGPDAKEQVIQEYEPRDFKIAANAISSYKQLKPISCDISSFVKQQGEYQITFRWDGKSKHALAILRVELELR